ncbi:MAG: uroporphyrinogen-III C-methyltransferase [Proteobacteria bacterium]|nr:uroporphyrinogen-III C-methyltransferase [Pseudomonadota bacterium]
MTLTRMDVMSMDEENNGSPGDKKPPMPKQVVVTHYGKKKKEADVPSEIIPTEPTHIISSPVDIGGLTKTVRSPEETPLSKPEPKPAVQEPPQPRTVPTMEPRADIFPQVEPEVVPQAQAMSYGSKEKESQTSSYGGGGYVPPDEPPYREKPPASGGGNGGAMFFSFTSFLAVLVLGYFAYTNSQQLSALQKQSTDDQTSVSALTAQTQKTLNQIQVQHTSVTSEQQSLEALQKQLTDAQAKLVTLSGNTDWVLAEANYLAFMANERLKTAQDVTTAVAQLVSADERIGRLANPALLWVREIMAKDIAKLRNFPSINRQAMWEQIGLISAEFNQLHFKTVTNGATNETTPSVPDETSMSGFEKALWTTWKELKGIIKITNVAQNTIPLALTAQEQAQILRTMHFMSEQAKWAVLQGENKIYHDTMQSMAAWLEQYFAQDQLQSDLLKQIKQLEQQNIDITAPDITQTVQALSKAMIEVTNKPASKTP